MRYTTHKDFILLQTLLYSLRKNAHKIIFIVTLAILPGLIVFAQTQPSNNTQKTEPQRMAIVPLFKNLPTINNIAARDVFNRIRSSIPQNINVYFIQGNEIESSKIPFLFDWYLNVLSFDYVVFVETIRLAQESKFVNFQLEVWFFEKNRRIPLLQKTFVSKIEQSGGQSPKIETLDINHIEHIDLFFKDFNTKIQEKITIEDTTVVINPDVSKLPKFFMRINNQDDVFPSRIKKEIKINTGANKVDIYQIIDDENFLVATFATNASQKYYTWNVPFVTPDNERRGAYLNNLKSITELLIGYQMGLASTQNNIFTPAAMVTMRYKYSFENKTLFKLIPYLGASWHFGAASNATTMSIATIPLGFSANVGGIYRFAYIQEINFGITMGGIWWILLENPTAVSYNNPISPIINLDVGYALHFTTTKKYSFRLISELSFLNSFAVVNKQLSIEEIRLNGISRSTETIYYLGASFSVGLGYRF